MDEPQAPLTERAFSEWLNDRRGLDVSTVFHDIVLHYRAALSTAPVQGVLTEALLAVFDHLAVKDDEDGNAPGHSHAVPGIWDRDNGLKAGAVCGWCNKWARAKRLRAALAPAPHPTPNTLGDALTGPGDPVASLPTPPIASVPTSEASRDL